MKRIAESSVRRLSLYLRHLEALEAGGSATVSSEELARHGGTTSAQVRKDLSLFGSFGKRGLGYGVAELSERLRTILGLRREWRVVIIGAGKIGSALAQYHGFEQHGFTVVGVYDADPHRIGKRWGTVTVRDVATLARDVARRHPEIAVVTVPAEHAQRVVDVAVGAGVRAILNFAPVALTVPDGVEVRNVNMALELEVLSYALSARRG